MNVENNAKKEDSNSFMHDLKDPFKCRLCNINFISEEFLKNHNNSVHELEDKTSFILPKLEKDEKESELPFESDVSFDQFEENQSIDSKIFKQSYRNSKNFKAEYDEHLSDGHELEDEKSFVLPKLEIQGDS